MERYPEPIEQQMQALYDSLSEKDRRRYAAVEAVKLGHGGETYIAELFGCETDTIRRGREDVAALPDDAAAGRVRKKGAPHSRRSTAGLARRGRSVGR